MEMWRWRKFVRSRWKWEKYHSAAVAAQQMLRHHNSHHIQLLRQNEQPEKLCTYDSSFCFGSLACAHILYPSSVMYNIIRYFVITWHVFWLPANGNYDSIWLLCCVFMRWNTERTSEYQQHSFDISWYTKEWKRVEFVAQNVANTALCDINSSSMRFKNIEICRFYFWNHIIASYCGQIGRDLIISQMELKK